MVGGCVAACIIVGRRRKARAPQVYRPPGPVAQDQVPMLHPPAQNPFSNAAAVPASTYPYAQAQNNGSYQQTPGYNNSYPAASHSNVTLSAYSQDTHANVPPPDASQRNFTPPPGPPPV
ncbi:hypothetical protein B0H17DRAFT_634831 [Mycena rosella]|uniref:Uncharacterized protein n=1 Tax=Mycena rosella TaxID=1033263 RepID=A0AAD7DER6_MYCRO|nr:hypothetical protein B0H17DRAFT_634831 [Mycena rosella]